MQLIVYTCLIIKHLPDEELIQLLKKITYINNQYHIRGCLVHLGNEFIHIVQGKFEDIYQLYSIAGVDDRIKYGDPIFSENECPFVFECTYIISESLYKMPGAEEIPILNYSDLANLKEVLGNKTLALQFFWKCMDDLLIRAKLS